MKNTSPNPEEIIPVTNMDQFVAYLSGWHTNRVDRLKHMWDIPESSEVSVGDEPAIQVTGEFRKGYQLGISLALAELGELPFVAELEESAAVELKH